MVSRRSTQRARRFVQRLDAIATDAERVKLQRYFKSDEGEYGEGDEFIGVRMGSVFALADEFRSMPLDEIEALLESPVHEARAGAVKIMAKQAAARTATDDDRHALVDLYLRRIDRINNWTWSTSVPGTSSVATWSTSRVICSVTSPGRQTCGSDARRSSPRCSSSGATTSTTRSRSPGGCWPTTKTSSTRRSAACCANAASTTRARLVAFLDDNAASMPRTALRYAIEHLEPDARAHYRSLRADRGGPTMTIDPSCTFVLIPGAGGSAFYWYRLVAELERRGQRQRRRRTAGRRRGRRPARVRGGGARCDRRHHDTDRRRRPIDGRVHGTVGVHAATGRDAGAGQRHDPPSRRDPRRLVGCHRAGRGPPAVGCGARAFGAGRPARGLLPRRSSGRVRRGDGPARATTGGRAVRPTTRHRPVARRADPRDRGCGRSLLPDRLPDPRQPGPTWASRPTSSPAATSSR